MAKIFKCKGIPYILQDVLTAIKNHRGVTLGDLVESIDDAHVVDKSKFYPE